ncbi:hypothetical protein Neosp_003211 [[Neocosmospora] mangrovei]
MASETKGARPTYDGVSQSASTPPTELTMSSETKDTGPTYDGVQNLPADKNENADSGSLSEADESVKLSVEDFNLLGAARRDSELAQDIVRSFNIIKDNMDEPLASELAEFLPDAWRRWCQDPKVNLITQHSFYNQLRGTQGHTKRLCYPQWFFLAAAFGASHPTLAPIREDMSALWGVSFPADQIFYPANVPAWRQEALFSGKRPKDTSFHEMEDRVEGFKAAIEDVDKPSIMDALTQYAPGLRGKAAYGHYVKDLREDLKDTRQQLQVAQDQLKDTQTQLRNAEERLDKIQEDLRRAEERLQETNLCSKDDLMATNRRVDKLVETCAVLLGILTAPGGEKREREEEQDDE